MSDQIMLVTEVVSLLQVHEYVYNAGVKSIAITTRINTGRE